MFTPKTLTITVLAAIFVGLSFFTGGASAAGQQSSRETPKKIRSISVHPTTPQELQAMRPLPPQRLSPEYQAVLNREIPGYPDTACSEFIGSVTVSQGGQTCTYLVVRLKCVIRDWPVTVTITDCSIDV